MIAKARTPDHPGLKAHSAWSCWQGLCIILCLTTLLLALLGSAVARTSEPASPLPEKPHGSVVKRGLVVLLAFPDLPHDGDTAKVQQRFSEHLDRYVREMSYGKVSLSIDVTNKWLMMPHPIGHYRISSRNLEVDKSRVTALIEDALDSVDKDVDFGRYAFIVLMLAARVADYGMVGLCGYPGMLGWSTQGGFTTGRGKRVQGGVAIFTSQAHLGTLFHDVAHILGGVQKGKRMVPCLYDHDLQAKPGPMRDTFLESIINMGFWDTMSCHFHKRELPPPGVSSWTKMRLGWMDQAKVAVVEPGQQKVVLLGPLEDGAAGTLAVKIPLSSTTYYLIENRQPLGFDANLPGSGVLVMLADDTISECRQGRAPVKLMNADPSVAHLEAAAFDVGPKSLFLDSSNGVTVQILEKASGSYKILIKRR